MNIWFNGTVSKYFKDVAIYLSKVDYVNWLVYDLKVLPDYSKFVTTKYLEKVN